MQENEELIKALNTLSQNIIKILKVNLDRDDYEIIKSNPNELSKEMGYSEKISEWLKLFAETGQVFPEDMRAYGAHTDLEYLRNFFKEPNAVWRLRYRRNAGDSYKWVMMEMRPTPNFSLDNKEVYLYVQDVDNELLDLHVKQVQTRQRLVEERLLMQMANEVLDSGNWHIYYDEKGNTEGTVYDQKLCSLYGYESQEEMTSECETWIDLVHPEDVSRMQEKIEQTLRRKEGESGLFNQEFRARTKSGVYRWFRALGEVHARADKKPYLFFGIMIDITSEKEYEEALQKEIETNEQLQEALRKGKEEREIVESIASTYNTIHLIDLEKQTFLEIIAMPMVKEYFEKNRETKDLQALFKGAMQLTTRSEFLDKVLNFVDLDTLPIRLRNRKIITEEYMGVVHGWLQAGFIPVKVNEEGLPTVVLFTTLVIDEQKRREENLIRISKTDELTRLYNRRAYENDIMELQFSGIPKDFVLVSMDVTGLKKINDSLGHAAGDELLQGAAQSMLYAFSTRGKVYRIGGDEFMAMLYANEDEVNQMLSDLDESTKIFKGHFVQGIVLARGVVTREELPDATILEVEKLADQRMYKNKSEYYIANGLERRKN